MGSTAGSVVLTAGNTLLRRQQRGPKQTTQPDPLCLTTALGRPLPPRSTRQCDHHAHLKETDGMITSIVSRPAVMGRLHVQRQPRTLPKFWHSRPLKPGLPASMSAAITSYTSSRPAQGQSLRSGVPDCSNCVRPQNSTALCPVKVDVWKASVTTHNLLLVAGFNNVRSAGRIEP